VLCLCRSFVLSGTLVLDNLFRRTDKL
jgi:hypothetical protein